jgi:hypothetical protein
MADPSEIQTPVHNTVARGDATASPSKTGHALQRSGYEKAAEQTTDITQSAAGRAVRRQPGQTARGK